MQSLYGFDNASTDDQDDDLLRWRFAMDIVDVIRSTPNDWSVRIGLFGRWGAGKTTVLRYIEAMLREKGSIVLNYNPAFDANLSEAVRTFGNILIRELEKKELFVEPKFRAFLKKVPGVQSGSASKILEAGGDVFKGTKLASTSLICYLIG